MVSGGPHIEHVTEPHNEACTCTALMLAVEDNRPDPAKSLVMEGANCSSPACAASKFAGSQPLHIASILGYAPLIQELLELGAEPLSLDKDGFHAVHLAAKAGHVDVLVGLIHYMYKGSKQNDYLNPILQRSEGGVYPGATPLHMAALSGVDKMVKFLIDQEADVNILDDHGRSLLALAAGNGHVNFIRQLLSFGATLDATDRRDGNPLLTAAGKGHLKAVEPLAESGSDLNARDLFGWSLLHYAVVEKSPSLAQWGLRVGLDPDVVTKDGLSPLHFALRWPQSNIAEFLFESGANRRIKSPVQALPLNVASGRVPLDLIRRLLENLATEEIVEDVNTHSIVYGTPLYSAASCGSLETVEYLIKKGAEIDTNRGDLGAPIHVALGHRHFEVVSFLLGKGAKPRILTRQFERRAAWYWEYGCHYMLPGCDGIWQDSSTGY